MVKIMIPQAVLIKFSLTKRVPEKINGAKRLKFLSVCLGRNDSTRLEIN